MRRGFLVIADTTLLIVSALLATYIRFGSESLEALFNQHGLLKLAMVTIFIQLAFYLFDLYDLPATRKYPRVIINMIIALGVATALLTILFYAAPVLQLGRGVFLVDVALTAAIIPAWRLVVAGKSLINPTVIGLTEEIGSLVERHQVDRIVVAVQDRRGKFPTEELLNLSLSGRVAVEESARYYERLTGKIASEMLRPSWLIFSRGSRFSDFEHHVRRVINVGVSLVGFVSSLPVMLLTVLAIKLDSRGPIFYVQERVGKQGRTFKIIKFRSMQVGAEAKSGPMWAEEGDPRVTRVGRIIRKLRIDELPQFINVIRGDMNFVGPRPERPVFVDRLSAIVPYYSQRHVVKPGLTGWAQIKYPYGASVEDAVEKLRYDLYYIKNQSLLLDAFIMFETIKIIIFGRGGR